MPPGLHALLESAFDMTAFSYGVMTLPYVIAELQQTCALRIDRLPTGTCCRCGTGDRSLEGMSDALCEWTSRRKASMLIESPDSRVAFRKSI
jgi:hypothetical protein